MTGAATLNEPRKGHLPARDCQYIAGEPTGGDAGKCGRPIHAGSAYCEEHHDACHRALGGNAAYEYS